MSLTSPKPLVSLHGREDGRVLAVLLDEHVVKVYSIRVIERLVSEFQTLSAN